MLPDREAVKRRAKRLIRQAHLLPLAEAVRFRRRRAFMKQANADFVRANPSFPTPPEDLAFDAYGHVDWAGYRRSGEVQAAAIAEILRAAAPRPDVAVLEWGCGPGRLLRHMPGLLGEQAQLCGCDYNARSIEWDRANLPGIRFLTNGLQPPLDLPDASFDAVYCVSVFTHLSEEMQLAWSRELARVLRPGGFLLCTTQGDAYRDQLETSDQRAAYDAGQAVVLGNYREGQKYYLAFHPQRFVRERLLAGFVGVRRMRTARLQVEFFRQDTWVGWKPPADAAGDAALAQLAR